MVNCTGIASPVAVQLIFSSTPTVGAVPVLGYSNSSGNYSAYTQPQTTLSGAPYFLLNVSGAISSATMPVTYNLFTFNLTPTFGAGNNVYQNNQFMPSLNPANYGNPAPSGGFLKIGGTQTAGFTSGQGARNMSLLGYVVYSAAVSATVVQQNFAAIAEYYNRLGIDITQRPPFLNTPQNNNITATGSSIDAGFLSQPPASYMTSLGSTYTVNNSAVSSSGTATRQISLANTELYWTNPRAGRNILFIGAPTNDLCEGPIYLYSGNTTPALAWAATLALANQGLYPVDPLTGKTRKGYDAVVIGTMISRVGNAVSPSTGSCDANKNLFNTIARNSVGQYPNIYLADIAEIAALGADGASSGTPGTINTGTCPGATTYFNNDCVHPVVAGSTLYGQGMQAVLQAITGYSAASPNVQTGTTYTMTPSDRYVNAAITAASTFTLPSCAALTGYTYAVTNTATVVSNLVLTMAPQGSETIAGQTTIYPQTVGVFTSTLTSPTLGGCYWQSVVQSNFNVVIANRYTSQSGVVVIDGTNVTLGRNAGSVTTVSGNFNIPAYISPTLSANVASSVFGLSDSYYNTSLAGNLGRNNWSWVATPSSGPTPDDVLSLSWFTSTPGGKPSVQMPLIPFLAKTLQPANDSTVTCTVPTDGGKLNFIAGATGVKDIIQVCGKDATNTFGWRPIY